MIQWILILLGIAVLFLIIQFFHLFAVLSWEDRQTLGSGYFGRSPEERARFKRTLARHAWLLSPLLALLGKTSKFRFDKASFEQDGLPGPRGTCSEETFAAARDYAPRSEDIFVVTQMKCGTTWMQHVVYEVLHRGSGDLVESGTALYGVSPWLESRKSVSVDDAPLLGEERPSRLIKTHFPRAACPWGGGARYIYVARHPASCFASCVDFIRANAGPLRPALEDIQSWFTSEDMWWGPWPTHVGGWWKASQTSHNVLFVRFEDMKEDLPAVVGHIVDFLGLEPLSDEEMAEVTRKCSFQYMQQYKNAFEMHPPHVLAVDSQMFVRGTADRHRDMDAETRESIMTWCREAMAETEPHLDTLYPPPGD